VPAFFFGENMRVFLFCFVASLFAEEACQRANLITTGEFLYWTLREDGLAFAQPGVAPISESVNVAKRKDTEFAEGNWVVGFRVGMGITLDHENWTALFQYTNISQSNSASHTGPLTPTWMLGGIQGVASGGLNVGLQAQQANGTWNISFNHFTLELGKRFGYFTPHIGLAATWQKQKYNVAYEEFTNMSTYEKLSSAMKNNNWGIGIRTGVHSRWMFNKTVGFYGDAALAALWSRFQLLRKDTATQSDGNAVVPVNNSTDFHTVKPYLDMGLGVICAHTSKEKTYTLQAKMGWEEQVWWNENQLLHLFNGSGNSGDLAIQGLTLSLRIDY